MAPEQRLELEKSSGLGSGADQDERLKIGVESGSKAKRNDPDVAEMRWISLSSQKGLCSSS